MKLLLLELLVLSLCACVTTTSYVDGTTGAQLAADNDTRTTMSFERWQKLNAEPPDDVLRNRAAGIDSAAANVATSWWKTVDTTFDPDATTLVVGKELCLYEWDGHCRYSPLVMASGRRLIVSWYLWHRDRGEVGARRIYKQGRTLDLSALVPDDDWDRYRWVRPSDGRLYFVPYEGERIDTSRSAFMFFWGQSEGQADQDFVAANALTFTGKQL